ncbi:MAG: OmpW family outer membrane protein [Bacteroidia bacterium]|nr:OmpW family outer membrane protein [Bacteroidia bacterium]
MKTKTFLTALLLLLATTVMAQTEKGKFLVSGKTSLDFTFSSTEISGSAVVGYTGAQSTYNFNITPAFGYFIIDNLAVSLQTSYAVNNGKTKSQTSQFIFMPDITYYLPISQIVRPFVQVGGGYVNISTKTPLTSGGKATQSFNGYTLGGGIGLAFFVKRNISLDLSGQYAVIKTSFSGDSSIKMDMKGFAGAIGFSLFF